MNKYLLELFTDQKLIEKIKKRLPHFYQLAELECSRAGKIGMEIGSVREKIIIALLIYKFGETNVQTEIPITEAEIDAELYDMPISIKTTTGKSLSGVKLIWTVDATKALEFSNNYVPTCDILLVQIVWNGIGGLFYIPIEAQQRILGEMGRENYIKLPKPGTNPRGVEITSDALIKLINENDTKKVTINWIKSDIEYQPYKRWVEYWSEND